MMPPISLNEWHRFSINSQIPIHMPGRIARITNLFYNLIMYKLFFKLQKTVKSVLFAIYLRKGNIYYMGKTKDVTTETTREVHGTIFDDVFRTIAQKMPYLLIPLINEV